MSKRPESSAEIQDQVRLLELSIEAEQAFDKKHPEDLHDDEIRERFIQGFIQTHKNDEAFYLDGDGHIVSYFEQRQRMRQPDLLHCLAYGGTHSLRA